VKSRLPLFLRAFLHLFLPVFAFAVAFLACHPRRGSAFLLVPTNRSAICNINNHLQLSSSKTAQKTLVKPLNPENKSQKSI
jgi:hypothetical protein